MLIHRDEAMANAWRLSNQSVNIAVMRWPLRDTDAGELVPVELFRAENASGSAS